MPELTSQMERELAELEAALAPVMRDLRTEPRPEFVHRLDRNVRTGSWHAPRPSRGRRWSQLLLSGPALGTAAAALLVALVIAMPKGGGGDEEAASGGSVAAQESGGGSAGAAAADAGARQSAEDSAGVSPDAATSSEEPLLSVPPTPGDG